MQKHSKDELQRQTIRLGLVWLKFTQPANLCIKLEVFSLRPIWAKSSLWSHFNN